jgi:hypothetical protein
MTYYISLKVIAFGNNELLKELDEKKLEPQEFFGPTKSEENIRIISCSFKSGYPEDILDSLIKELKGLSMIIQVGEETGYETLLYKDKDQKELFTLFTIEDCLNDEFFENFDPAYLNKFDKIHLDRPLIEYIRKTSIGCAYTNLLINHKCYA